MFQTNLTDYCLVEWDALQNQLEKDLRLDIVSINMWLDDTLTVYNKVVHGTVSDFVRKSCDILRDNDVQSCVFELSISGDKTILYMLNGDDHIGRRYSNGDTDNLPQRHICTQHCSDRPEYETSQHFVFSFLHKV